MVIKYKAGEVAKDLALQNKELLEVVGSKFGEGKKHTTPLTEEELNFVFEHYTKETEVKNFDDYLASAPQDKPAPVPAEPLKKADGTVVELKRTGGSNIDFKAPKKKETTQPEEP